MDSGPHSNSRTSRPSRTFVIGGQSISPGNRLRFEIPVARLPTGTHINLPIEVIHGPFEGPTVWVSAAVHGDELNGVEIARLVLDKLKPNRLFGTLIVVPMVNGFGVINQSRYLPDRRDLNRCFPGSKSGSLASRLAHLMMTEVVQRCQYGIDLHTGANYRTNLPQVRGDMDDIETYECALAFNSPVVVHSDVRDGSLRAAAKAKGIKVLLYEAGEPMRFNPDAIKLGVSGVMRVLTYLNMLKTPFKIPNKKPALIRESTWVRARRSGIVRLSVELGDKVTAGQKIGLIADVFGDDPYTLKAPFDGIVIGHSNNPIAHQGDGILHVGAFV
ncbi:deacylase [Bremerella cremea]|uniref:Deacylase n=1 Tax=Bremerella cremea TaxID=1031537 RepID=A0A368KKE6_9BACT|nr:succinylglutamate desuccinylase/aspartoacylase family protein [Bremerella cremea]RCS41164.1 deacylase [Bremerella cremea]